MTLSPPSSVPQADTAGRSVFCILGTVRSTNAQPLQLIKRLDVLTDRPREAAYAQLLMYWLIQIHTCAETSAGDAYGQHKNKNKTKHSALFSLYLFNFNSPNYVAHICSGLLLHLSVRRINFYWPWFDKEHSAQFT